MKVFKFQFFIFMTCFVIVGPVFGNLLVRSFYRGTSKETCSIVDFTSSDQLNCEIFKLLGQTGDCKNSDEFKVKICERYINALRTGKCNEGKSYYDSVCLSLSSVKNNNCKQLDMEDIIFKNFCEQLTSNKELSQAFNTLVQRVQKGGQSAQFVYPPGFEKGLVSPKKPIEDPLVIRPLLDNKVDDTKPNLQSSLKPVVAGLKASASFGTVKTDCETERTPTSIPEEIYKEKLDSSDDYEYELRLIPIKEKAVENFFVKWSNRNLGNAKEKFHTLIKKRVAAWVSLGYPQKSWVDGIWNISTGAGANWLESSKEEVIKKSGEDKYQEALKILQEVDKANPDKYKYGDVSEYFNNCIQASRISRLGGDTNKQFDTWSIILVRINKKTKEEQIVSAVSAASQKGKDYIYHIGIQRGIEEGEMLSDVKDISSKLFSFAKNAISLQYGEESPIKRTLVNPLPIMQYQITKASESEAKKFTLKIFERPGGSFSNPNDFSGQGWDDAKFFNGCYNGGFKLFQLNWN